MVRPFSVHRMRPGALIIVLLFWKCGWCRTPDRGRRPSIGLVEVAHSDCSPGVGLEAFDGVADVERGGERAVAVEDREFRDETQVGFVDPRVSKGCALNPAKPAPARSPNPIRGLRPVVDFFIKGFS
jgi:hypothetical protein